MKRVCIAMCVLAIVFCSCQKENLNSKIGDASITAFAPSETKTSIDGVHVTWNSGDEIQVWEKNTTNTGVYELANGAGTGLGSFDFVSGTQVANGNFVGIYPNADKFDVYTNCIRHKISLDQDGDLTNEIPMYGSFVNDGTGKYKIQFNHAFGIVRIILSGDAEKVKQCKAIKFSTFNGYKVNDCFKIYNDGKLAYEQKYDTSNQIDVSFPDMPAVDGKKTIDVLFAPTINTQSQPITVNCNVWFKESLNGDAITSHSADLLVKAGKIKVINVNFKND